MHQAPAPAPAPVPELEAPEPLSAAWGEAVRLVLEPGGGVGLSAEGLKGLEGIAAREAFLAYLRAPAPLHAPAPAPAPAVNHPAHYHPGAYEAIAIIAAWALDFWSGNAVKYIARAGRKGGEELARQDIEKALWYVRDARARQRHELSAPRYVEAGAAFGRFTPARVAEAWGLRGVLCDALDALARGALDDAEDALHEHLADER